jgi:hypothetical protein
MAWRCPDWLGWGRLATIRRGKEMHGEVRLSQAGHVEFWQVELRYGQLG